MNINNINDYIKSKLNKMKYEDLNKYLKFRHTLKKNIYNAITHQHGGDSKISLDKVGKLVSTFKEIDKTQINSKMTNLKRQIEIMNKLVDKTTRNVENITLINLDMIINEISTYITKISGESILKKNIKIKIPEQLDYETELHQFDEIQDIKKIIEGYTITHQNLTRINLSEITEERIREIIEHMHNITIISEKINKMSYKIRVMTEYSALKELEYNIVSPYDILLEEKINLDTFKAEISVTYPGIGYPVGITNIQELKQYLNETNGTSYYVGDVERRIINPFMESTDAIMGEGKEEDIDDIFELTGGDPQHVIARYGKLINTVHEQISIIEEFKINLLQIVNKYNYECFKMMYHNMFMIGVFNEIYTKNNYMVYTHLDAGLVNFYVNMVKGILEKIKKGNLSTELLYFKKYHLLNLKILKKVLTQMEILFANPINLNKLVNITMSAPKIRYGCLILNFLKEQIINYYQKAESNITIYARINDWGDTRKKLFTKEGSNTLVLRPAACVLEIGVPNIDRFVQEKGDEIKYKFNAVYDEHQTNETLSTFMGLKLNVSNCINTGLITYGYSGTGKTYTLFGSTPNKTQGLLQDAIKVGGVECIYFRIYELYGMGFQYPFYWEDVNKIYNNIYHYDISLSGTELNINDVFIIPPTDFENYTKVGYNEEKTVSGKSIKFVKIDLENIKETMDKFESLITKIDDIRKRYKRIRETPNNPESSRSVIIYDFVLEIPTNTKKTTNFLIIDLPGKENIEKTYIDKYYTLLSSYELSADKLKYYKMLLLSTSLQPLLISIIDPKNFIAGINKSSIDLLKREKIKKIIEDTKSMSFNYTDRNVDSMFNLINIKEISLKKSLITWNKPIDNKLAVPNYGMFFMYQIIHNNHFDILEDIIREVIDNNINKVIKEINAMSSIPILLNQFKIVKPNIYNKLAIPLGEPLPEDINTQILNLFKNINPTEFNKLEKIYQDLNELSKQILLYMIQYDYYLTPYEGLYINENIVGIIKYCEGRKGNGKTSVISQNVELTFDIQRDIVRGLLLSGIDNPELHTKLKLVFVSREKYKKCINDSCESPIIIKPIIELTHENYGFKYSHFDDMYKTMIGFYEPNKIYNITKPVVQTILSHYLDGDKPKISDFKMFYLVSNNSLEIKCTAQEDLLRLTKDFIENISS